MRRLCVKLDGVVYADVYGISGTTTSVGRRLCVEVNVYVLVRTLEEEQDRSSGRRRDISPAFQGVFDGGLLRRPNAIGVLG